MHHALIIEDNLIVSKMIELRLKGAGFGSFDHAWTEEDAVAAAELCNPDLVVVGDTLASGSPAQTARRISSRHDIPILFVTADAGRAGRSLPGAVSMGSLFALHELADAAEHVQPNGLGVAH